MKSNLRILVLLSLFCNVASGAVLISTLGGTPVGFIGAPGIATDFTTGATSTIVTQLTFGFFNGDPNSDTFLEGGAHIFADNAGSPDTSTSFGSFSGPITAPANSGLQYYTLTSPGFTLQPSTTYWLGFFSNPGTTSGLMTVAGQAANAGGLYSGVPGTQMKTSPAINPWSDSGNTTPLYELQGTSVPEPSRMVLLLGSALAGLCLNRRRTR